MLSVLHRASINRMLLAGVERVTRCVPQVQTFKVSASPGHFSNWSQMAEVRRKQVTYQGGNLI